MKSENVFYKKGVWMNHITLKLRMAMRCILLSIVASLSICGFLFGDDENIDNSDSVFLTEQVAGDVAAQSKKGNRTLTAGTLDTTYNSGSGEEAGFLDLTNEISPGLPAGSVEAVLQNSDGSYFVLADNGLPAHYVGATNSYLVKFDSNDLQDETFGGGAFVTISGMKQACDMTMTQQGNLVVVGQANYPAGMVVCLNPTSGAIIWTVTFDGNDFDYNFTVAQQPNGRIIIAGATYNGANIPSLIALNPFTGHVDITFGDNGYYKDSSGNGYAIDSMAIDTDGYIYFILQDGSTNARTYKLSADGTTVLWTSATSMYSTDIVDCNVVLDQQGNVVVATGGGNGGPIIHLTRYSSIDGTVLASCNLDGLTTGLGYPYVRSLLIDQTSSTGNLILIGYDGNPTPSFPFVMRVLPDLSGLDTSFNSLDSYPGVQPIEVTDPSSDGGNWTDGFISPNGKITIGGFAIITSSVINKPYLMRLYGNDSVGEHLPDVSGAGTAGTIDTGFGVDGYIDFQSISGSLAGLTPQVVLPISNGYQYVAFTNGTLIRLTNGNVLDTTFGDGGFAQGGNSGVHSMFMDGNGCLVLAGSYEDGPFNIGWIMRYLAGDSGLLDTSFSPIAGYVNITNFVGTVAVQQTLARYILAGQVTVTDVGYNGVLYAYTDTGAVDTTFGNSGVYDTGITSQISGLISDEYDRLIFAYVNPNNNTVNITRLTASGELDLTFGNSIEGGYSGTILNVLSADDSTQVRLAFDAAGNIVVAAHNSFNNAGTMYYDVAVAAYENGTGAVSVYDAYPVFGPPIPTNIILSDLIASADGNILISGSFVDSSPMWVACGAAIGGINSTYFNPDGSPAGIMLFDFDTAGTVTKRNLNSIAIYPDGEISMVGTETDTANSPTVTPFMSRAFYTPYTTQEIICQDSLPIGTNDPTFGVTNNFDNGITFFATATADSGCDQYAQAIALQDDNNIVVAFNGQTVDSGPNQIIINIFDVDGLLNTNFNPEASSPCAPGQAIVLDVFDNQYVQDMMTFSVNGINKAILVGYATSDVLNTDNSLLMQYDLTLSSPGLDSDFGGYNGNPVGVCVSSSSSQAFTVGRQSMGRIIVGGVTPSVDAPTRGLLQAYTSNGLLDQSFGLQGYFIQGNTGIYTTAIDSQDRVLVAYYDGDGDVVVARILADGSDLDSSFNSTMTPGTYSVSFDGSFNSDTNFKIALDQSGNIFVVAIINSGTAIVLNILDNNGNYLTSAQYNGSTFGSLHNFTITQLLITANATFEDEFIVIVGYDQVAGPADQIMVASFSLAGGEINTNALFNTAETPGYIKYAVGFSPSTQQTSHAIIHPDGRIIIAGSTEDIP